uniref:40S ribosomal protein S2 n=1 Tax=Bos indicus x Bos taurus TaxID=30522 RepID=A0A4W2BQV6_BOBOX
MADDAGALRRPRGPGGPWNGRAHGGKAKDKVWLPVTKLGCLVKDMKIKSLEEISLFSLPIKEYDIIDFFLGASLKDEVLKIAAAQTRFKAFVAIRDYNGHVGSDVKCSKAVATAIRGTIILAKLSSPCDERTRKIRLASPTPPIAR